MDAKEKRRLRKMKDDLYRETIRQREQAWYVKDFRKSYNQRQKEQINFEKWKLLDGLLKEMEKENEDK